MPPTPTSTRLMSEIDRRQVIFRMANRLNTFMMGMASIFLLNTDAMNSLEGRSAYLQGTNIWYDLEALDSHSDFETANFDILLSAWRSSQDGDGYSATVREFATSIRRSFITESYELVYNFAHEYGILSELDPLVWFHYARIIRNSMSHDYHIKFQKFDRKFLPLTWNGITIDASMEGIPLDGKHMSPLAALKIHLAMCAWIAGLPLTV